MNVDEYFSDEVLQKAKTAKIYIEHLYRVQSQNARERQDRRAALEQQLQGGQLGPEARAAALAELEARERQYSRLQRQRLSMEDFEPLRLIGKGAFGEVRICRDRSTGKLVAVKKLQKSEMVRRGQVRARRGRHMKLSDFGLCKPVDVSSLPAFAAAEPGAPPPGGPPSPGPRSQSEQLRHWQENRRKLAFSTVGTPDYIAPDPMTTCRKIVNWRTCLRFPPEAEATLSPAARDFMCRLLTDVDQRLGTHGAAEIQAHPFFAGVAWGSLYEATPPYRPPLAHELDTQNFEQFEEGEAPGGGAGLTPGTASRSRPIADPHFIGYTYKDWDAATGADAGSAGKQRVREASRPAQRPSVNQLQAAFHDVTLGGL
eukprot:scaffold3.g6258.t1